MDCPHNGRPTTPLRLLYLQSKWAEALAEIERLKSQELDETQRTVVTVYEVAIPMLRRTMRYSEARVRMSLVERQVLRLGSDEFTADFRSMRIGLAHRMGDQQLAVALITSFFDGIDRTPATEAMWRMAQGRSRHRPEDGLPFFVTVVMNLEGQGLPCLREMAARWQALCSHQLGDDDQAVAVLRSVGIPASVQPAAGEIPLSDLLLLMPMPR